MGSGKSSAYAMISREEGGKNLFAAMCIVFILPDEIAIYYGVVDGRTTHDCCLS